MQETDPMDMWCLIAVDERKVEPDNDTGSFALLDETAAQLCLWLQARTSIDHLRRHLMLLSRVGGLYRLAHPRWWHPGPKHAPTLEWSKLRWPMTKPGSEAAFLGLLGDVGHDLLSPCASNPFPGGLASAAVRVTVTSRRMPRHAGRKPDALR